MEIIHIMCEFKLAPCRPLSAFKRKLLKRFLRARLRRTHGSWLAVIFIKVSPKTVGLGALALLRSLPLIPLAKWPLMLQKWS